MADLILVHNPSVLVPQMGLVGGITAEVVGAYSIIKNRKMVNQLKQERRVKELLKRIS